MTPAARILLVEDDPVTRAFIADAVRALGAEVVEAGDIASSLAREAAAPHALWLCDAHLPDGTGAQLLAGLRARSPRTPAVAHTASQERAVLDGLIAAGYAEVLVKPLGAAALQAAVRRHLPLPAVEPTAPHDAPAGGKQPVWDDAGALRALNGNQAHVRALRDLFRGELPGVRDAVAAAAARRDLDAIRDPLHRLCASCGFVGAARLEQAVRALQADPFDADALARFLHAAGDTLVSLDTPA